MKDPIAVAKQIIDLLESLEDEEKDQGLLAARNLRDALSKVSEDRESALGELQYGLSAKGVLDWQWRPATYAKLDALCSECYRQCSSIRGVA